MGQLILDANHGSKCNVDDATQTDQEPVSCLSGAISVEEAMAIVEKHKKKTAKKKDKKKHKKSKSKKGKRSRNTSSSSSEG